MLPRESVKPRAQFGSNQDHSGCMSTSISEEAKEDNNNHYNGLRGGRPPAPVNSLASATRIINHHLFGTISSSRHNTGTTAGSKLSLSADSIDSEATQFVERHRKSKSILKKSESTNNYYSNTGDSDTEKLITDNTSITTVCDNEAVSSDAFRNVYGTRLEHPVSPLLSRQVLESIFRTNNNARKRYATDPSEEKSCLSKLPKSLFDDALEEEKQIRDEVVAESKNKGEDRLENLKRVAEAGKDNQSGLTSTPRSYKTARKSNRDEKRNIATSKSNLHSSATLSSDSNCLPQEYRFS